MYITYCERVHPQFSYHSPMPSRTYFPNTFYSFHVFFFFNTLSLIRFSCMCVVVGLFTGPWATYQWLQPENLAYLLLLPAINCQ